MTSRKLRGWRGVKPVAAPPGVTITARLRTSADEEFVLDQVAAHLGGLRRADLAATAHRPGPDPALNTEQRRQVRRDELNGRKRVLTAQSSSRWANAIIAGNDDQYRLACDAQYRHIIGLRAAITTIEKRLAAPTSDTLTVAQRRARRKAGAPKGYASQGERFGEQCRLQHLRAELAQVHATTPLRKFVWSRVAGGWPAPGITSTTPVSPPIRGANSGRRSGIGSPPTAPPMSRSAI